MNGERDRKVVGGNESSRGRRMEKVSERVNERRAEGRVSGKEKESGVAG